MKKKAWYATILVLLMTGMATAQTFTPDPSTATLNNDQGEIGELEKNTALDQFLNSLSALSVTLQDKPDDVAAPGETVKIRVDATFNEQINLDGTIKKALVYYCPTGDLDCPEQEERPRELKVAVLRDTSELDYVISKGESYSFPLNYKVPEDEGLYKVYGGVTSPDESRWVTDVTSTTFRVEAEDTSTGGGTGGTGGTGTGNVIGDTVDQAEQNPLIAAALLIGLALIAVGVGFGD